MDTLRKLSGIDHGILLDACNAIVTDKKDAPSGLGDGDVILERKGFFLWIETKQPHESDVPLGQKILLEALDKKPGFTVIVLRLTGAKTGIGANKLEPTHCRKFYTDSRNRRVLGRETEYTMKDFVPEIVEWWKAATAKDEDRVKKAFCTELKNEN